MNLIANVAVVIVALLHIAFLVLEMFLWTKPFGRRVFGLSAEIAQGSAPLAMNQGLYNGFLAAGLLWGVAISNHAIEMFFLICVIVAGIFGALTAKRTILFVQALPGVIALIAVVLAQRP